MKGRSCIWRACPITKKSAISTKSTQNLHKVNLLSTWAAGLSKISAARDSFGYLTNGLVDPGAAQRGHVLLRNGVRWQRHGAAGFGRSRFNWPQQNYNLIVHRQQLRRGASDHQPFLPADQRRFHCPPVAIVAGQRGGHRAAELQQLRRPGPDIYQGQAVAKLGPELVGAGRQRPAKFALHRRLHHAGADDQFGLRGHGGADSGLEPVAGVDLARNLNGAFGQLLPVGRVSPATRTPTI